MRGAVIDHFGLYRICFSQSTSLCFLSVLLIFLPRVFIVKHLLIYHLLNICGASLGVATVWIGAFKNTPFPCLLIMRSRRGKIRAAASCLNIWTSSLISASVVVVVFSSIVQRVMEECVTMLLSEYEQSARFWLMRKQKQKKMAISILVFVVFPWLWI